MTSTVINETEDSRNSCTPLKSPFPWAGGKSSIAADVWSRFGDVQNYVEPFAGSLAVLLARPHEPNLETVNDLDGYICNAWRAIQADPVAVAEHANWPVIENDLHARHSHLVNRRADLTAKLEGDTEYYDAKLAGWWLWGIASWIGSGWCSGEGPWRQEGGELIDSRQLPHLSGSQGINRQLPHLGGTKVINRKLPHLGGTKGINRKLEELGGTKGINRKLEELTLLMQELSDRLCRVRICCGDWSRVCGPSPTFYNGITAVFLDPPYLSGEHSFDYAQGESNVAADVHKWCLENGDNPLLRIALCGYDGNYEMPSTWECVEWKAKGGYGNQGDGRGRENAARERIWFSPHCLSVTPAQTSIFDFIQEFS